MAGTSSRVVAYLPSMRTFLSRLRATSLPPSALSAPFPTSSSALPTLTTGSHQLQNEVALRSSDVSVKLGLTPRMGLPGTVGLPSSPAASSSSGWAEEKLKAVGGEDEDRMVECQVRKCPVFLQAEFMGLFPGVSVERGELLVITLNEQTFHDMSGWTPAMEQEREELLKHFVDSAKEICSRLAAAGYWADFIDPSSGRAFYADYTNLTLFETDDRFRYLGFDITDLGCCKCISHPLWGTHMFVGTIFSNAPLHCQAIQEILHL